MASGDRIELLTADTFETAMNTVAKESTVQTCAAKVDNVDADIAALAATINNINSVNTADYQLDQSMNNVLADLYNNRIGATNNTGGTAAAGTMMAKLNALINSVNSIQASTDNSLHSKIFIPSDDLLKTIYNQTITLDMGDKGYIVGCFVAKYSGTIRVKASGSSSTDFYGTLEILINKNANYSINETAFSPTMPITKLNDYFYDSNFEKRYLIELRGQVMQTHTMDIHVKAGDILYFRLSPYKKSSSQTGTNTFGSVAVYGTTTLFY